MTNRLVLRLSIENKSLRKLRDLQIRHILLVSDGIVCVAYSQNSWNEIVEYDIFYFFKFDRNYTFMITYLLYN